MGRQDAKAVTFEKFEKKYTAFAVYAVIFYKSECGHKLKHLL